MRIFGRNQGRPYASEYEEPDRVLEAVTYIPPIDTLRHKPWYGYESVFQQTAFEGPYGEIVEELGKIQAKVVFND